MLKTLLLAVSVALALFSATADAKPKDGRPGRGPNPISAPEFDAKTAGAAVALLVGGAVVLTERLRRRK